jgi:hypothetical protein
MGGGGGGGGKREGVNVNAAFPQTPKNSTPKIILGQCVCVGEGGSRHLHCVAHLDDAVISTNYRVEMQVCVGGEE